LSLPPSQFTRRAASGIASATEMPDERIAFIEAQIAERLKFLRIHSEQIERNEQELQLLRGVLAELTGKEKGAGMTTP